MSGSPCLPGRVSDPTPRVLFISLVQCMPPPLWHLSCPCIFRARGHECGVPISPADIGATLVGRQHPLRILLLSAAVVSLLLLISGLCWWKGIVETLILWFSPLHLTSRWIPGGIANINPPSKATVNDTLNVGDGRQTSLVFVDVIFKFILATLVCSSKGLTVPPPVSFASQSAHCQDEITPPPSSGNRQPASSYPSFHGGPRSEGEPSSPSPINCGSEDPESNLEDLPEPGDCLPSTNRDIFAYALYAITILAYCGMAASMNSVDTTNPDISAPRVEVNVIWLLSSLITIVISILCKTGLWWLHYGDNDWIVSTLLLPEFYMALFCVVALFGHANLVGQQHFDPKTFVAAVPVLLYALIIRMLLGRYNRAPSFKALFSLIYPN
ncbi:uncharacterized protein STEHIDRAFT_148484 [Stereum hirsutum FP-91666 SS1]|uniref:uncharacterized protein n=1 Tax=Stereum hirsutum (strain FP-91666) TaxID=721885 RepID=UPI00044492E4|nr:uncharacterized protein STEHIDRAFT_148484 [Stereum hirsutum FP-91666 SS1]EIM84436.1 hypothetical protein STEHIDRAFT_148484 [Stereum hirsutum FP-91666 SS1]